MTCIFFVGIALLAVLVGVDVWITFPRLRELLGRDRKDT